MVAVWASCVRHCVSICRSIPMSNPLPSLRKMKVAEARPSSNCESDLQAALASLTRNPQRFNIHTSHQVLKSRGARLTAVVADVLDRTNPDIEFAFDANNGDAVDCGDGKAGTERVGAIGLKGTSDGGRVAGPRGAHFGSMP